LEDLFSQLVGDKVSIVREMGSGVNNTFLIKNEESDQFVVKCMTRQPLGEVERYRFQKSQWIYEQLGQRELPSLEVHHADTIFRQLSDLSMHGIMILPYSHLTPLENAWSQFREGQKISFTQAFASFMRSMHQIKIDGAGDILIKEGQPRGSHKNWKEFIAEKTIKAVRKLKTDRVRRAEFDSYFSDDLLDEALEFVIDMISTIPTNDGNTIVHGDLWQGNVLISPEEPSEC